MKKLTSLVLIKILRTSFDDIRSATIAASCCALFMGLTAAMQASANDIELAISNDMIDLRFRSEYERDFSGTFAYLHADFKDIESDQLSYGFETRGQIENVIVKLGSRLFFIDAGGADGFGAALGIGVEAFIVEKVSTTGQIYYSPEIITGGDLDNTLDAEIRVNYQLIENGALFVGYRVYEVDAEKGGSADIYDDPYLGIKFTF